MIIDKNLILDEAANADADFDRTFSKGMSREVFDTIAKMDPKTYIVDNQIKSVGPVSKYLLLPGYMNGETSFVDDVEKMNKLVADYSLEMGKKYPKFNEFKSVADFITFMENPESADIEKKVEKSKMDILYDSYYSDIPRDIFNEIIELDSKTAEDRIGDVAKNLLLIKYKKGEKDILDKKENIIAAIDKYYEFGDTYPDGKDNIQNFSSIEEFVNYVPQSPIVAAITDLKLGVDYELVASSSYYDVFKILSWTGSRTIAHVKGAKNVWCTAGGSTGSEFNSSPTMPTSYYKDYQPTGSRRAQLYEFISRVTPTVTETNYNLAVSVDGSGVYEFRDGNNKGYNKSIEADNLLKSVLIKDKELTKNIVKANDEYLSNLDVVKEVLELINSVKGPFNIESKIDLAKVIKNRDIYKQYITEIYIKNLDMIPTSIFADFIALRTCVIGEGVKQINAQAFKDCYNLKSLTFGDSLEFIGVEAFSGCKSLDASIRLPNSVTKIGVRAFDGTHCKLKIDRNRTKKLQVAPEDRDWIVSHMQSIQV